MELRTWSRARPRRPGLAPAARPLPVPRRDGHARRQALALATLAAILAASCRDVPSSAVPAAAVPAAGERVYVVNTGDESLSVIDPATRTVVATVALGSAPHGQVPSPDGRRLYVTTGGRRGEILALDTATNAILWRLAAGASLHTPALSRNGRLLFAPDFRRGVVVVADVAAGTLEGEIPVRDGAGGPLLAGPHNAYAGASGRFVYQTALRGRALARIDVATRRVDRVYPLAGEPRPAALLADESRIYLQLSELHGLVELDLRTGAETARIAWPEPAGRAAVAPRCHGLGIAPGGSEIWAASSVEEGVRVLALPTLAPLARVALGGPPEWIAFSRDGRTVYVTIPGAGREPGAVAVVDRASRTVVATIPVGIAPKRVHTLVVPGPAGAQAGPSPQARATP